MIKIFTLLSLLLALTFQKGQTKKELQKKLIQFNRSPLVSLLLVYDSEAPNTTPLLGLMNSIADKRKGYFNVIKVDCNTDDVQLKQEFIYCGDQYRKQLPALIFSQPSLNQQLNTENPSLQAIKPYQGQLDDKNLFNFAVPLMKTFSSELKNSRDLKKFEESYPDTPHIIYFTDKQKQKIPPLYRALTANFRNTIVFGHIFSSSQLAKDMNITKFPIFLLNGKQKIEVKSNLTEIVERFSNIEGQPLNIFIKDTVSTGQVELNDQNLDELVYKLPEHILIHVVGENGVDHPAWANVSKKFSKMFKFYQTFTLQAALGVKNTPAIVYFPKSIAKKSVQKTVFTTRDSFDDIYKEIDSIIEDFTVPLSNFMELQKLTGIHLQDEKFVAIFFHSQEIPMSYKILSNDAKYQDDIAFFRMKDPEREIVEQYQLKKIPALIIMIVDKQSKEKEKESLTEKQKNDGRIGMNLKIAFYQGRFNYQDLSSFFNSFSRKAIEEKQSQTNYQSESSSNNKIQQIKKSSKLKKICSQGCFLLLLNGNPENADKNKNYLALLQKQSSKIIGGNFGYLDGLCHSEFISTFDIQEDELPAFIHIQTKFQKYSRMIGRLESSSITSFFSKIKSRKAMYRGYDKLNFENKDCEFELDKLKKMGQKSETISEDEAAILEQLRAEEEKKRQQFEKAQKQDKTRKKNRKKKPKKQEEEEL